MQRSAAILGWCSPLVSARFGPNPQADVGHVWGGRRVQESSSKRGGW